VARAWGGITPADLRRCTVDELDAMTRLLVEQAKRAESERELTPWAVPRS
jgi:hypothetical protein